MKFRSGGQKMRNASGQQCKVKMRGSEKKKSEQETRKVQSGSFTLWSCKTTAEKCTKKVCCTCKVAFLLIRPIVVFPPFSGVSLPLSITRFYILFEQTINIIESLAFTPTQSIYYEMCLFTKQSSLIFYGQCF